jgi:hypothetical protein
MGFFDGLTNTWKSLFTDFPNEASGAWHSITSGGSDIYHGFLTAASAALNGAMTPVANADAYAQMGQGLKQMLGGGLKGLSGVGNIPVIRQIGETSMWASKQLVNRPYGAYELQVGDAAKTGSLSGFFSGDAWKSAYNSTRTVTAGQAFDYAGMSLNMRGARIAGIDPTNEPGWLRSTQKWLGGDDFANAYQHGPEGFDPRTPQGQDLYHKNLWLKSSSGTMDAGIMLFLDPTKGLSGITKAGKLKFVSKEVSAASASKLIGDSDRWSSYVDSKSYQKTYNYIKGADNPETVRRTLFNNHYSGGVMANALWSVKDDPDLYNTTFRAFYGDQSAWDDLVKQAPRLAQVTGTKFANFSISQVSKNVGVGDPLADYVAGNKLETDVQAFADAIADGRGFWGKVSPKTGGLLIGQNTPQIRLTSKWRAGANQWLQYGPNTMLGVWQTNGTNGAYAARSLTRTLLPSSRGGRLADLNNPDSQRIFTNNLQQSRLTRDQVDNFSSMYARASTAESRFGVVNQAENAATRVHALAHGVEPETIDQLIDSGVLNKYRSGNRAFIRANKRFISSDARRLAQTNIDNGNDKAAEGLRNFADDIDSAVDEGRWPVGHVAMPDEDGNLNLIPLDSTPNTSRPITTSQYADAMPMQDWGALDSALWYLTKGSLGRGIWHSKEALTTLAESAASLWKITAIMRPGYIWRTLSDEAGGPIAVMGAGDIMPAATEGVKNAWHNMYNRAQLVPEYVSRVKAQQAAKRLGGGGKGRGASLAASVVDEAPASPDGLAHHGNDPDYTAYTFGNNLGHSSFDTALASGTLGVGDFMDFLVAHGSEGQLPHDYQMIYNGLKDGSRTKAQTQKLAVDHALANAGMNAYDNPAWQQAVIQAAIDARKTELPHPSERLPGWETAESAAPIQWNRATSKLVPGSSITDQPGIENALISWFWDKAEAFGGSAEPAINAALRGKVKVTPKIQNEMGYLDKAFEQSKLTQPITVYRRYSSAKNVFPEGWQKRDLTGLTIDNVGYTPTSTDPKYVADWAPGAQGFAIRMELPKGSPAINLHDTRPDVAGSPAEMLLPRGMTVKVVKDWGKDSNGLRWLDVEPVATGQGALAATPAKLTRASEGHHGHYEGEGLTGPEGMGTVRSLSEYEGVEYVNTNGHLRQGPQVPREGDLNPSSPFHGLAEESNRSNAQRILEIDKTMGVSRLTSDVKVYRALKEGRHVFGQKTWYGDVVPIESKDLDAVDAGFDRWAAGKRPNLTGVRFTDKAYSSTTADPKVAEDFGKRWKTANSETDGEPIVLTVDVPKGTGAVQMAEWGHAAEILLQRGLTYEVTADHGVVDGYRRLDVKVVNGPGAKNVENKPQGLPGQPIVIDPRTGTSPSIQPQRVNHLFSLGDAHVFPANTALHEEVGKFIDNNMDELLKPSNLLHAYVQPDGNMAMSVARYTGGNELQSVKPGSGRRVSLGGAQSAKMYRGAGETGWDARWGPGENDVVHVRGMFEGPQGDLAKSQVSSRGPYASLTDRITNSQHARLMANTPGEWDNLEPGNVGYDASWERAVNQQLANDKLARQFIANPPRGDNPGFTVRDAVAWMHNTNDGRAYQARMGAWQSKYYEQIHQVQAMVDSYVPFSELQPEASDALRKAVLKREASIGDMARVVSRDDMPQIHGASLQQALGKGWFPQKAREITDKVFGAISDMPNDKLLRFPFTANRYKFHVDHLLESRANWFKAHGDTFTQDDLDAVEGLARERTLVDARRYLYDTMASHDLAKGLRLLIPFGSALADSAHKWGVVLKEKPTMAADIWKLWSLPDRSGLIQDQDGNHMEVKDGKEIWFQVDPKTGVRKQLPDTFTPNGKVIVFRLPVGVKIDGAKPLVSINKTAFQTFLDIPTFGPLVTIPANNFSMSHPEFATNRLVKTFILPYGPTNNSLVAAVPGNVRNWKDAYDTFVTHTDTQNAEEQAMAVYMTEMVDLSQGKRTNAPTFAEARSKAAQMQGLRFISRLSGVTSSFQSPYQPYIDYYHMLQQQDPGNADKNFYNQMGPEFFWLTSAVTRNALGIPATVGAFNQYKKFQDLMQQFPDLAPLISGAEGAGAFNKAVYESQKQTPIRYGTQKNERALVPLADSIADTQKRLGWVKWTQFNDALLADMFDRGLTSLQQKGAEDLLAAKQDFIDSNSSWRDPYGTIQISPWYQDYTSQDLSKMTSRLTQMHQVIQDPRLQGREDIRGLITYLDARSGFTDYMDQLGVKTLNGPITVNPTTKKLTKAQHQQVDLTSQWNEFVFNLKASNPQFANLYDRWLTADDSLNARVITKG